MGSEDPLLPPRRPSAVPYVLCALGLVLFGALGRSRMNAPAPVSVPIVLRNSRGMEVHVLREGGIIQRLLVPSASGALADVVLGFDDLLPYLDGTSPYFGAIVGRVANRVANATFTLGGRAYTLAKNERGFPGSLHGGARGFDKVPWGALKIGENAVMLRYHSVDGEEGYPGNVDVEALYELSEDGALLFEVRALADRPTPFNVAQHSYFNLAGHQAENVLGHRLRVHASHYTPVDEARIPTGELRPVDGTPFDFRSGAKIGDRTPDVHGPGWRSGFDHNFALDKATPGAAAPEPQLAAALYEPESGRVMHVLTTLPGLQVYTSNFLDGTIAGKGGARYQRYGGVCLEAQGFPNAVHEPRFPSVLLTPGTVYHHRTIYAFSTCSTDRRVCKPRGYRALLDRFGKAHNATACCPGMQ